MEGPADLLSHESPLPCLGDGFLAVSSWQRENRFSVFFFGANPIMIAPPYDLI